MCWSGRRCRRGSGLTSGSGRGRDLGGRVGVARGRGRVQDRLVGFRFALVGLHDRGVEVEDVPADALEYTPDGKRLSQVNLRRLEQSLLVQSLLGRLQAHGDGIAHPVAEALRRVVGCCWFEVEIAAIEPADAVTERLPVAEDVGSPPAPGGSVVGRRAVGVGDVGATLGDRRGEQLAEALRRLAALLMRPDWARATCFEGSAGPLSEGGSALRCL